MKKIYSAATLLFGMLLGNCMPTAVHAQREADNWYFGNQAGVTFASGAPVSTTNGVLSSYEACSSVSTATGGLVMYSNGENVWDASHQLMPNGSALGGHTSASQSVLLLKHPGNATQYYIFTVDAIDNNLVGGLRYSLVDMSLRSGLGDVVPGTKSVRLPTPTLTGKVTEKLTAALHSNGRDYWIIVHGWESNAFYSFLLSPTGISITPVVSNVGSVHSGGGSFFGAANAVGYMKVSPQGTHLALAKRDSGFELYGFNNATGSVSNYTSLSAFDDHYSGIEFSPDNSKIYTTTYQDGGFSSTLYQYNLLAGSASAISSSRQTIANVSGISVALQLAPDNKIYIASYNRTFLHTITAPNASGSACAFVRDAVLLAGQRVAQVGLPNFPNRFANTTLSTTNNVLSEQTVVYPNPAHDQVSLALPSRLLAKKADVTIFNAAGLKVYQQPITATAGQKDLVIRVSDLAKGVYTLRVQTEGTVINKQLLVQ